MSNQDSSGTRNQFGNYYDLHIGSRDGTLHPPTERSAVEEIRAVLQRLEVGDRIVFRTTSGKAVEPRTVTAVTCSLEDETAQIEIALEGPSGGRYELVDRPHDTSSKWERPRARDVPRTDGSGRSAPVTAVVLVAGTTRN